MIEEQPIIALTVDALHDKVKELSEQGNRLVQIGATTLKDTFEVNYSFDREGKFQTLRVQIPGQAPQLPSVSDIYWCAFLYENEMHDLFGIQVTGNVLDFKGKFYQTAVKFPFACAPSAPTPAVNPSAAAPSAASTTKPVQPANN